MLEVRCQVSRSGPATGPSIANQHRLHCLASEDARAHSASNRTASCGCNGRACQCVGGSALFFECDHLTHMSVDRTMVSPRQLLVQHFRLLRGIGGKMSAVISAVDYEGEEERRDSMSLS